jgi:hypothetical protein
VRALSVPGAADTASTALRISALLGMRVLPHIKKFGDGFGNLLVRAHRPEAKSGPPVSRCGSAERTLRRRPTTSKALQLPARANAVAREQRAAQVAFAPKAYHRSETLSDHLHWALLVTRAR